MCTQPNVIEALREAEAALELAIQRILKRDPGHHVEVTSEAKALVSVRQALQCQGCDVPKDGVYQISEPSHSMSQYASKDDMLRAVMAENEQLRAQLAAAQQGVLLTNEQIESIEKQVWDLNHFDEIEREGNRKFAHLIAAATRAATQGLDAKDAARYRWLRDKSRLFKQDPDMSGNHFWMVRANGSLRGKNLDAAIDAAIAAQAKQGGEE